LDEVIYSANGRLNFPYPSEDLNIKALLNISVASNQHASRTAELVKDPEVNELAIKVAKTLPHSPLMAIDFLRDEETGKLYVLELNLGGNVWHFSSKMVRNLPGYDSAARKKLVLQYNAWDRSAEALVRKTHELAS
jgi:predicted ATP-grasp superfamily ATP-dependent carboligase